MAINIIEITSTDNDVIYITFATMQVAMMLPDDAEMHFCIKNPLYVDNSDIDKVVDKVILLSKVKPDIVDTLTNEFNRYCGYLVGAKNTEIVDES